MEKPKMFENQMKENPWEKGYSAQSYFKKYKSKENESIIITTI